jgi:hypothetical protein
VSTGLPNCPWKTGKTTLKAGGWAPINARVWGESGINLATPAQAAGPHFSLFLGKIIEPFTKNYHV